MSKTIIISDETYKRIQALAEPFIDTTPESVVIKLLDHIDGTRWQKEIDEYTVSNHDDSSSKSKNKFVVPLPLQQIPERESRQRGIKVRINNEVISASSVSDLYEQVLIYIVEQGYFNKLRSILPIRTSRSRYLAATKPEHPNGNDFFVPVKYNGVFMEAHKDYKNGLNHLRKMLNLLEISLEVLG